MRRSAAPSVMAARKRQALLEAGIDPDPPAAPAPGMPGHNQSAFDIFVSILEKFARRQTKEPVLEEDGEDENDTVETDGECYYFAVYYSARQTSRTAEAAAAADSSGEGLTVLKNGICQLLNMDCKSIGRATARNLLKFVERQMSMMVGNKEIQVQSVVEESAFRTGQFFLRSVAEKEVNKPPPERVVYTLAAARLRLGRGKFTCPLISAPDTAKREPWEPLHSPYVEGAVVLFRAKPQEKDEQGRWLVSVVVDPVIGVRLRPHQRRGVKFMFDCVVGLHNINGNGCILADDMGLGKSLQAIAITWTLLRQGIHGTPTVNKAAIVCPSSLVGNWAKEFNKWLGDRVSVKAITSTGKTHDEIIDFGRGRYDVLVVSYEQFMRHADAVAKVDLGFIICDEGHRLKNADIKTTKALAAVKTPRRVILSGTPIQNDLEEFFCMCDFVNPGVLGSYDRFKRVFETEILLAREPDATPEERSLGEARSKELTRLTSQFILRRTNQVLSKYLPPKYEYVVFCGLSDLQRDLYKKFGRSGAVRQLLQSDGPQTAAALGCITALKKLCNHPQLVHAMATEGGASVPAAVMQAFPKDFKRTATAPEHSGKSLLLMGILREMRAHTTDKIVIVSNYTQTLDLLARMCDERRYAYLRLDGTTPLPQRQKLVDQFNDPKSPHFVFFLSSKAGGCGLNLVGANRLVLYDPDWNPASDLQAMARVWRDGQQKNVFIYRLLSTGTIEEKVYQRQTAKQGLSKSVLAVDEEAPEAEAASEFSAEELRNIFLLNEETVCDTHDLIRCKCAATGHKARKRRAVAVPGGHSSDSSDVESRADEEDAGGDDDELAGDAAARRVSEALSRFHHYHDVSAVSDPVLAAAAPEVVTFTFAATAQGEMVPIS